MRIVPFLAVAALLLGGGCEHGGDKEDSDSLSLHVSTHVLHAGEECEVRADLDIGNADKASDKAFSWSLSDSSIGRLSCRNGRSVKYIPTRFPAPGGRAFTQTIYCKLDGTVFNLISDGPIFNHHASQEVSQLAD